MKSYPYLELTFTDKCKHIYLLTCRPEALCMSVRLSVYQSMQLNPSAYLSLSLSIYQYASLLFIGLYI